jgi:hypothetical protein
LRLPPPKDLLVKGGLDVTLLQPYTVISLEGVRHKTKAQKIWVEQLDIMEEN